MPRVGSVANACTEVSTPERTRKVPTSDNEKVMIASRMVQLFSVSRFSTTTDEWISAVPTSQGMIGAAFLLFILLTSNPFIRVVPAPLDGNGLNPLLQDPGLAFHPPFLYLGYVGFSISFSFAIAALIEGRIDAAWARWVRPWTLAAWMLSLIHI